MSAIPLADRITAALYGGAIGDGMGAPVEGQPPEAIAARFTGVERFLPPTHGGDPRFGKGDGRITDDTLMTEALVLAYRDHGDHLDAHDAERFLLPWIAVHRRWIPEWQREAPSIERLFWPEKWPWIRLHLNHAEPRSAGIGNCVNCGVAMYMMPVGAVNAGDPQAAYDEAAAFTLFHNESYAVEAGAAMAAAFAAAFAGADAAAVAATARDLARDGTRRCLAAAIAATDPAHDLPTWIRSVRAAVAPFDSRAVHVSDEAAGSTSVLACAGANDAERPSRERSIEELPVALAALLWGRGDFLRTLHAAVFYGRDCDSIAGMAAGLFGAIHGSAAIPADLRAASDTSNRRDFAALAATLTQTAAAILAKDEARWSARRAAAQSRVAIS
ncbi:MAG: hypothetical protein RLZZ127_2012 [Planctomycetota bacterium]|jgi:ADP-ribosylglycohydrolase